VFHVQSSRSKRNRRLAGHAVASRSLITNFSIDSQQTTTVSTPVFRFQPSLRSFGHRVQTVESTEWLYSLRSARSTTRSDHFHPLLPPSFRRCYFYAPRNFYDRHHELISPRLAEKTLPARNAIAGSGSRHASENLFEKSLDRQPSLPSKICPCRRLLDTWLIFLFPRIPYFPHFPHFPLTVNTFLSSWIILSFGMDIPR